MAKCSNERTVVRRLTRKLCRAAWCGVAACVLSACALSGADDQPGVVALQSSGGLERYRQDCQSHYKQVNRREPLKALGGDEYTALELMEDPGLSGEVKDQVFDLPPTQVVLVCVFDPRVGDWAHSDKNMLVGFWANGGAWLL